MICHERGVRSVLGKTKGYSGSQDTGKLPYFLTAVEFIDVFVTGYVGTCPERACSGAVVILGTGM